MNRDNKENRLRKVAIIGSVGVPAIYGGFETLAEYLTAELGEQFDLTVFCSSKSYSNKIEKYNNAELKYVPLKANGFQSIPYDIISIARAIKKNDTLLILGVAGCFTIPIFRLFFKRKFIVNIDGSEWKRDKWGRFAKWYLKISESLAVKYADIIVADNKGIKDAIEESFGVQCELIPYGADHVFSIQPSKETVNNYPFLQSNYAFSVCRIEPENNIHLILESFSKTTVPLVIVGNWDYNNYGRALKNKYSKIENIHLLDPIYDQNLLNELRSNCEIYVHGHSAGGTNPSLVEAMMLGLNVIAFDVNFNRYTTENQALYFNNSEQLKNIIKQQALFSDIGVKLREIAIKKYQWSEIAKAYSKLF